MIALPLDLAPRQHREAVRSFMRQLGRGRIPWCAAFHDAGHDRLNPHVHIVFRDRDIETNRRVIGTSAGIHELSLARRLGRSRPPFTLPDALRRLWREHVARFRVTASVTAAQRSASSTSRPLAPGSSP